MDSTSGDALGRTDAHLALLTRGREAATLQCWRRACPSLAHAPVTRPEELKPWVHSLPTRRADVVLRDLVALAQRPDPTALLAVLSCLAPGIRSLAARAKVTCDEALSEVAFGVLDFPYERRSVIAAGLLLDARNRLHRSHQRMLRTCPLEDGSVYHSPAQAPVHDPGDPEWARCPAQHVVQLVCQAHRQGILDRTETELILRTRVAGHGVKQLAPSLGLTPSAAYQRRSRAEARLASLT